MSRDEIDSWETLLRRTERWLEEAQTKLSYERQRADDNERALNDALAALKEIRDITADALQ